jgi:hypothetical protein
MQQGNRGRIRHATPLQLIHNCQATKCRIGHPERIVGMWQEFVHFTREFDRQWCRVGCVELIVIKCEGSALRTRITCSKSCIRLGARI